MKTIDYKELFPSAKKLPSIFSEKTWQIIRYCSMLVLVFVMIFLYLKPDQGLFVFWRVIIPIVPLFLFISTGFWRNLCPVGEINQIPTQLSFSKDQKLPEWPKKYGIIIAIFLLLIFVTGRKLIFNTNAYALIGLLLLLAISAFIMGFLYKGKSGWCSTFCPVMTVERLYGHSPFISVRNCYQDCVGCTKNCFDVAPDISFLKNLYDKDTFFFRSYQFFAGIFPGFVCGFYLIPDPPQIPVYTMYLYFLLYCSVSGAALYLLSYFFFYKRVGLLISIFGALAINCYYWFNAPLFVEIFTNSDNIYHLLATWFIRTGIFVLSLFWIKKSYIKEQAYILKKLKR
ncbi:MAG: ferredoxin-type membrane protein [Candidatus Magnetoglobus multicellularis str. Araruama]|uniref:Ferredoxin-type membrane protein n=1 Tax=Candidatus Magnetoglobus multicellularis str. Araruama TaxID=890399 RepID=A0A1V1P7X5_9BACT|nr:MAG: ferredoxin-type membrane protein [Candidatus Magnetoglobus multicellularis str. Araruama]